MDVCVVAVIVLDPSLVTGLDEVEVDGKAKSFRYVVLTDLGLRYDPDEEEAAAKAEKEAAKAAKAAAKAAAKEAKEDAE